MSPRYAGGDPSRRSARARRRAPRAHRGRRRDPERRRPTATWSPDADPADPGATMRRDRDGQGAAARPLHGGARARRARPEAPLWRHLAPRGAEASTSSSTSRPSCSRRSTHARRPRAAAIRSLEAPLVVRSRERVTRAAVVARVRRRLAHRIEAGADLFLMPSRYDPAGSRSSTACATARCRSSTRPAARRHGRATTIPPPTAARGFVFRAFGRGAAPGRPIRRALASGRTGQRWQAASVGRGMACDFSWDAAATRYRALYDAGCWRGLATA